MFSVLVIVLSADHIARECFGLGQLEISLIASLGILRAFRLGAGGARCPPL
jgi:hypothetical protein